VNIKALREPLVELVDSIGACIPNRPMRREYIESAVVSEEQDAAVLRVVVRRGITPRYSQSQIMHMCFADGAHGIPAPPTQSLTLRYVLDEADQFRLAPDSRTLPR
jgi:hypothetical protein